MRNASNVQHGLAVPTPVAFGAGGHATGIQVSDAGTFVIRTDSGNAWVRGTSDRSWTQLIKMGASGNVSQANGQYNYASGGSYEAAIAATNSNYILVIAMGNHYLSTDKGVTFSKLSVLAGNANYDPNNGQQRLFGRRAMFDPAGTAVIATTDPTVTTGGLYYSTNTGSTFTKNASVPAPTATNPMYIAFDRSSSVVSGKTQTVYVWSPGNAIRRSTTGIDGTFAAIAGSPTTGITAMEVIGGKLYVCGSGYDIGDLQIWNTTSWSTPTSGGSNVQAISIAADPTTSGGTTHIVACTNYGGYSASSDNGATWTLENAGNKAPRVLSATLSEVPWHATNSIETGFMPLVDAVFDPANAGNLWCAGGIGVWKLPSAPLTQGTSKTWQDASRGIENMGIYEVQVTPTGRLLIAAQDRCAFAWDKSRIGLYHRLQALDTGSISQGSSIDYASDDETYLVTTSSAGANVYVSRDGGKTWTGTATVPPGVPGTGYNGSIAVGPTGHFVYLPGNNLAPYYTANGGTTWTACKFNGNSFPSSVVLHWAAFYRRRCIADDKAGNTYLYAVGDGSGDANDLAYRGMWKSTDGGANYSRVRSTCITTASFDGAQGHLHCVPAHIGHLFWATGIIGSALDDTAANVQLQFSADGGATWANCGIYEPEDVAISGVALGSSYATLHARGYTNAADKTTFGTYRCTNFDSANPSGATWVKQYDFPQGCYDLTYTMAGDPTQWDRFYEGKWGSATYACSDSDPAHAT